MAQTDPSSSDADGDHRGLDDFFSDATQEHEFSIQISYDILRQVSSQLYTNPRRAIEELVCNSYDAAATECYVSTPKKSDDVLQVLDNGVSMDKDELEILWEVAGGSKKKLAEQGEDRKIDADDVKGRRQIGRFGVGKLAAFALGNQLTHVATKDGVTRIVSVSQQEIEGHDMSDPPNAEVYRMDEDEAREYLGSYLKDVPDPWDKDWDSWTLAVVDDIDEESTGRDLKPEYLDRMIRTAIPRSTNFIIHKNGREIDQRDYPDETYASIDNLADDEDAREKVQQALKEFWVGWSDDYDDGDDVPEEKYKLETVYLNPYEETSDEPEEDEEVESVSEEGDEEADIDEEEESEDESSNEIAAVEVDELGPVIAQGSIYKELLTSDKLQDRNLHDYGFKVTVRGKLLNRGDPHFGTADKVYKWFYRFAGEVLRNEGYDVHESGVIGTDGGWDARIEINGRKGIGHASVDNNWRGKLRDDAESVEELEDEQDESFDLLVFITNQRVTGQQELDMEAEIAEEYGWDLKILHRRHIIGITGHERPDLAERHFGFNPKRNDDHLDQIIQLRDERLDLISNRDGVASDLEDGPVAVVHLIPNGVFSGNYVQRSDDLPGLPRMGKLNVHPGTETVGKGKLNAGGRVRQPYKSYTYLQKDGLYEAVDTWVFREDEQDGLLLNNARDTDKSLDCKAGIAVQAGIRALKEMGVTGTVFCFISLLDAKGATIAYETRISGPAVQQPLRTDRYTTDLAEIPLAEADVTDSLRNPLTEIWQELGWNVNLHYDEDGNWMGPTVRFEDIGQFPSGG